jgi:hypothetical protein
VRRSVAPQRKAVFPVRRWSAGRPCLVALGVIACFIAVGIGAAVTAWSSPGLPLFEACDLVPAVIVAVFALWPAAVALRGAIPYRERRRLTRLFSLRA